MVMITARICNQAMGELAIVSRGSMFTGKSPYSFYPAPKVEG